MSKPDEKAKTASNNGDEKVEPVAAHELIMAQVVLVNDPIQQQSRLELRLSSQVGDRLNFCLTLSQIVAGTAHKIRLQEQQQAQAIAVPKIQLPPGVDLKGLK